MKKEAIPNNKMKMQPATEPPPRWSYDAINAVLSFDGRFFAYCTQGSVEPLDAQKVNLLLDTLNR